MARWYNRSQSLYRWPPGNCTKDVVMLCRREGENDSEFASYNNNLYVRTYEAFSSEGTMAAPLHY